MLATGTGLWPVLERFITIVYGFALSLGGPGLFLIALADSSFLSLPEGNDLLLVLLSTGQSWTRMLFLVGMTVLGSVTGCILLYTAGRRGRAFIRQRIDRQKVQWVGEKYARWGSWAVLIPSLLPPPTPFKIFVLSAGLFKIPFYKFLLAVSIARSIRYLTWGVLAVLYGEWAVSFLEIHSENIAPALIILVILATGLLFFHRYLRHAHDEMSA